MLDDLCARERLKKWQRTAIKNRWFGGVHCDDDIVDAQPSHRRQRVLHRVEPLIALTELRPPFTKNGARYMRRRLRGVWEIRAAKHDASTGLGRHEGQAARTP